jgi:hypothetical protein
MSKQLDIKSSFVAGIAGGILLWLVVKAFDAINSDTLYPAVPPSVWLLMGFIVGFSVQVTERFTGAS